MNHVTSNFKVQRVRSPRHMELVRWLGCAVPGCRARQDIHAHHVRRAATSGTGAKPGDDACVPLCARHHLELHQRGEITCSAEWQINLAARARRIAEASRMLGILPLDEAQASTEPS